jgi:ubiquinone/menaquinone biosynthesis C-methylase UbiE
MIGQATYAIEPASRRWLRRIWGYSDIHTRQKWIALWPHLRTFSNDTLSVLDAGCGRGNWTLELAKRRPNWCIKGVDLDSTGLQQAEKARRRLGLVNVSFVQADFEHFYPQVSFDLVLSVASAHYLAEMDKADLLFERFQSWLKPMGTLLLFVPRCQEEMPSVAFLPSIPKHSVFSSVMLNQLCQKHGLQIELLEPKVGRYGVIAKQLAQVSNSLVRRMGYPLQLLFNYMDKLSDLKSCSAAWIVLARKCTN